MTLIFRLSKFTLELNYPTSFQNLNQKFSEPTMQCFVREIIEGGIFLHLQKVEICDQPCSNIHIYTSYPVHVY